MNKKAPTNLNCLPPRVNAPPSARETTRLATRLAGFVAIFILLLGVLRAEARPEFEADLIVYGGNSAGVMAAVQAKRMGKSAIIVGPDRHLGGLSSGGLGFTDTGNKAVIGGLAREFYHRLWLHYQEPEAWKWQSREEFGNRGQGTPAIDGDMRTMWVFEPHVAEQAFEDFVREYNIPVHRDEWLDRENGVQKDGARLTAITMLSGKTYRGQMFIDATYEGDLMATAGVDYHVGREGREVYGEEWAGFQPGMYFHRHNFAVLNQEISAYRIPGDPSSGALPRISTDPPPTERGEGDHRVQAYCFRMCLTDHPENRVPFPKPEGYDPDQYELLLRIFDAGWRETFQKFDRIPNRKTDSNNHGPFSTDNIGFNYDYPEASHERRREIIKEHETYQKGWLYFIANDPRVPKDVQEEMRRWGLARDEFVDNGHWPHQLYIREARRMIGHFIMTENELLKRRPTPESVGMGSYNIDSHNVQRYITPEGYVRNEGDVGVRLTPYQIAYGSLLPKRDQAENLLVPVCVSSSHIAYGSIRMEPVFMILAQSAATAAVLALDAGIAVQDLPYEQLRQRLLADGQVLEFTAVSVPGRAGVDPKTLKGVVVDDGQADLEGPWLPSTATGKWVGTQYRHDNAGRNGRSIARFETRLPETGRYEVRLAYSPHSNRASRVPVEIHHAGGHDTVHVNQNRTPPIDDLFIALGVFEFTADQPAVVIVSNRDTDGYVIVDAVQWLPR
jgi:hypothetical protein